MLLGSHPTSQTGPTDNTLFSMLNCKPLDFSNNIDTNSNASYDRRNWFPQNIQGDGRETNDWERRFTIKPLGSTEH